jgi:hypothetical protein
MVKINGKDVQWEDPPTGDFLTDVKISVLWQDEETGAHFRLIKFPQGGVWEFPHVHPEANQVNFGLSGEIELPDGRRMSIGEGKYSFRYFPKGQKHGPEKDWKVVKDAIALQYLDGPPTKVSEQEFT